MKEFKSPQTESIYTVYGQIGDDLVCYRSLGNELYRVRIQCNDKDRILCIEKHAQMKNVNWSSVKDNDHISIVVKEDCLIEALGDAIKAVSYCNDFPPMIQ